VIKKPREGDGLMVKVEEENGENRKEGEKCDVVKSRVAKELSHSSMHVKKEKKGLFLDKLLPKNYFAGWSEKKTFFDGIRRKICCFEDRDIESEAGSSFFEAKRFSKEIQGSREFYYLCQLVIYLGVTPY